MDWDAIGAIGEFVGAVGSLAIAFVVAYIAARQWMDWNAVTISERSKNSWGITT